METGKRGRVIIKAIREPEKIRAAKAYLMSTLKSADPAVIDRLLNKAETADTLCFNSVPFSTAHLLIRDLGKLGIEVVFLPHEGTPGTSAPMAPPTTVPTNVPAQARRFRPIAIRLSLLICVLGVGLIYVYSDAIENPFTQFAKQGTPSIARKITATRTAFHPKEPDESVDANDYFMATADPLARFDLAYAPRFDKRVANAFLEAVEIWARLFAPGKKPPETAFDIHQIGNDTYNVRFTVTLEEGMKEYDVPFSPDPAALPDTLENLAPLLRKLAEKHPRSLPFPANTAADGGETAMRAEQMINTLNMQDLFGAVRLAETAVAAKKADARLLYLAAEALGWFAFTKNYHTDQRLADMLSTQALAVYLVARAIDGAPDHGAARAKGIILLGMDYPAVAAAILGKVDHAQARLAAAYLKNSQEEMAAIAAGQPSRYARIAEYLEARAMHTYGENSSGDARLWQLASRYPDCTAALEFAVEEGDVTLGNQFEGELIASTLANHLSAAGSMLVYPPSLYASPLQSRITAAVSAEDAAEKWLDIEEGLGAFNPAPSTGGGIVTAAFMTRFFSLDSQAVSYSHFQRLLNRLDIPEEAEKTVAFVEKTYPGSETSNAMRLEMLTNYQKMEPVLQHFKEIDQGNSGNFLGGQMLWSANWFVRNHFLHRPYVAPLIQSMLEHTPPNAWGELRLYRHFEALGYLPLAHRHLARAQKLDPFRSAIVQEFSQGEKIEPLLSLYGAGVENSYGPAVAAASWYSEHGDDERALHYYRRAAAIAPAERAPHEKIARILKKQKRYKNAAAAVNDYLRYDNGSLSAVHMQNLLFDIYMDMKEFGHARALAEKIKDSYQRGALMRYARINEHFGNTAQAEEYFKKAVERYPASVSWSDLAMFYLRQGNRESAVSALKDGLRFNHRYYYHEDLVKYSVEHGVPALAEEIVRGVEPAMNGPLFFDLAAKFAAEADYATAFDLVDKALNDQQVWTNYYVPNYLAYGVKAKKGNEEALTAKLIERFRAKPTNLEMNGILLLQEKRYEAAFETLMARAAFNDGRKPLELLFAAAAWRAGNLDARRKERLLREIAATSLPPRQHLLVSYLLGETGEKELIGASHNIDEVCEAHFYAALIKREGTQKDEAFKHLIISLDTGAVNNIEYGMANDFINHTF